MILKFNIKCKKIKKPIVHPKFNSKFVLYPKSQRKKN